MTKFQPQKQKTENDILRVISPRLHSCWLSIGRLCLSAQFDSLLRYAMQSCVRRMLFRNPRYVQSPGFTLVEILLTLSIMSVLSLFGFSGYQDYSQNKTMDVAAEEVQSALQVAQSRARSQVKPDIPICDDLPNPEPLYGYQVAFCPALDHCSTRQEYQLRVVCGASGDLAAAIVDTYTLPSDIFFTDNDEQSVMFRVLTGEIEGVSQIGITGYERNRTISIASTGVLHIANALLPTPTGGMATTPIPVPTGGSSPPTSTPGQNPPTSTPSPTPSLTPSPTPSPTPSNTPFPTPTPVSVTKTFSVTSSRNDGGWSSANFFFDRPALYVGYFNSYLRYRNVDIPQGASITNAYIKFVAYNSFADENVKARFYANDVDFAVYPTNVAGAEIAPLTSASVPWNYIPLWTQGSTYLSPNISGVVQEVVDRPGWQSGNAMLIFIKDNGSDQYSSRYTESYDSNGSAPQLVITYQ